MLIRLLLILFAAAIFAPAAPSMAADKAEIEKIVEEYINTHPEVIVRAVQKYQAKLDNKREEAEFRNALADRKDVSINGAPVLGSNKAPITIVEFSDFQCPYCARSFGIVDALIKKHRGKVRLAYKHFPLGFHKRAKLASKASMAAERQGKFWPYRALLMAKQSEWSSATNNEIFSGYAKFLGLDVARFNDDMSDPKFSATINGDMAEGQKLGVRGTPTYFVNGVIVRGARPMEYFEKVIDALQKEKS